MLEVGLKRLYQSAKLLFLSKPNRSCFPPLLAFLIKFGNVLIQKPLVTLTHPIIISRQYLFGLLEARECFLIHFHAEVTDCQVDKCKGVGRVALNCLLVILYSYLVLSSIFVNVCQVIIALMIPRIDFDSLLIPFNCFFDVILALKEVT